MRIYRFVSAAIGGILMAGVSTSAFAGCGASGFNCKSQPAPFAPQIANYEGVRNVHCLRPTPVANCNPGVNVIAGNADVHRPVNAYTTNPFGYLQTIQYKNSPNVNIMRVHSRAPLVGLADRPVAFTNGCNPVSTAYCRSSRSGGTPVNIIFNQQPKIAVPVQAVRIRTGSGYNPANFAPRQYGHNTFTPGIANIPTSIVDRSPITHIGGVAQRRVSSVTTAHGFVGAAPVAQFSGHNVLGHVVSGSYSYQPPGGGAYWEKTSGPTVVGGLPATQILCRRQAPRPAPVRVQVIRPVIGVPVAVPTPICAPTPVCAPRRICAPQQPTCVARPSSCGSSYPVYASRYGSRWSN